VNAVPQPAGNFYDKYHSANPIARRLMNGFLAAFDGLVAQVPASRVLEVGCGEGELSMRLARRGFQVRGCDISADIVEEARRRATAAEIDAVYWCQSLDRIDVGTEAAPLVVCCEVLEHVDAPVRAIDVLADLASPYLLASVPREPLWRLLNIARLRYVRNLGNTPGHVNHWSRDAFRKLLEKRFDVLDLRSPLPWTMALCSRR
jgi:2-polyprenyl-3-methyl-5-hydroxy-6-metoxy-1,4-benzoquinol methylase